MLVRERIHADTWVPPWLRFQHVARYEWARRYCRGTLALDAACGIGYGSILLRAQGAMVSLDIAIEALAEARVATPPLRLVRGDTTRLPFKSGSFGAFVSFETIEHLDDDNAYAAEARRVVQTGG
ncbi:MAG TPA: class I SAM-dependent methyltransferase, partial [Gemmatimonadaceae bacterium]